MRGTLVAVILAGLAAMFVIGQRLSPPDWLRDRIEARIERGLNGMQIAFGDVEMVIRKGWRPRLRLRDVVLSDADGRVIAQLSNAEASLAMRPLLRGQVQPRRILLSGAFATLRRDRDGRVALSLGQTAAPMQQAEGVTQLIERGDRILLLPQLSALASVEIEAVTLRYEDARQGKAWTLDGGQVLLERSGDQLRLGAGFALLSGRDYASSVEMNYASRIGSPEAEFGVSVQDIPAQDIAAQSVALTWLEVLRAPISGALRGSVDGKGAVGTLSATLQIGAGVLQPTDQTRPIPFSGARSYFSYSPDDQTLVFDEVSVDSAWGSAAGEGRAYLGGIENGALSELVGQFTLSGLRANPAGLYPEPLALDGALADFRLDLNPFRLTLGQMSIADRDGTISLSGDLSAAAGGWQLALNGQVDRLTPQRLVTLWPAGLAPKPRQWVADNVFEGVLEDIDFAMRMQPGQKPDIYADFDFSGGKARFQRSMPPITGAAGQGTLHQGRFVITTTAGIVTPDQGGAMDIAGSSFIIPDIGVRPATPAVVRLTGSGSVTGILSLLNRPPIQVLKGTPLPVDLAAGSARVEGTMALPLKNRVPFSEITFHVTGEIDEVSSTVLVPGQTLSANALRLQADQTGIELSGTGRIGTLPVVMRWRQPIGPGVGKASRVDGQVELSQLLVDTFAIGLPAGSVSGQGTGSFTLDIGPDAPPELTLRSDLQGVGLSLPPLGWRKPQAEAGLLELSGTLGDAARIDRLVVQAAGLTATGTVLNRAGGGLDRALLSSVRLGGWLEAGVELVGRGRQSPDVHVLTGVMDLRRMPTDSGGSGGRDSGPLKVRLDRLQVSDSLSLTDFNGDFTTVGGLSGVFSGKLNGQTPVSGRIVPQDGRSAVQIESSDAGGVFRSAGILNRGRDGSFLLTLTPVGAPGHFDGVLKVRGTRVTDAPAIAALLNAISVVGLLDEMSGQGIQFSEVDARFRLEPDRLVLLESSAVGPSIGLSMDGIYDLTSGRLKMRGVISPVYMLNAIGSILTRKGEGMIGFSYTLSGAADAPSVQVNPLSGLAPGILREVFRGAPPQLPVDGEEPQEQAPRRAPDLVEGTGGGR